MGAFFAINEKPTGSRDPFALRRAALGTIRLILENQLRLNLASSITRNLEIFYEQRGGSDSLSYVNHDVLSFIVERLKIHLREQGTRHDLIALTMTDGGDGDRLRASHEALASFSFAVEQTRPNSRVRTLGLA